MCQLVPASLSSDMAVEDPLVFHDFLNEINPPNRMNLHYDRSTSVSNNLSKEEDDDVERQAKLDMLIRWTVYGSQLGYEPAPPQPSRTLFGKPCLALPNVAAYVRHIKARDGRLGLWTGFGANFCNVLVSNLCNDLSYHLIDEFVKRKIRSSPRKAWSVFTLASQENTKYSVADFAEDLSKEVLSRLIGLSMSYPFQVLFLRTASQFVWQERVYRSFLSSFQQIYDEEGFGGFYGGYAPYLISQLGALIVVWIGAYAFRSVVTGDRLWLSIFRFAMDYVTRTILYPFRLVGRIMAVSAAPLRIVSPPILPKFRGWLDCYRYLRSQGDLMRGSNAFIRVVSNGRPGVWEKYGYIEDPQSGLLVSMGSTKPSGALTISSPTAGVPFSQFSGRQQSAGPFGYEMLRSRF